MSKDMKNYVQKLSQYLDIAHPYTTMLGSDASDDLSRFDYVADITNDYIAEDDFDPQELNDLINQVSSKVSASHTLTKGQLAEFIKLVKNDTYTYEGQTLSYIEN